MSQVMNDPTALQNLYGVLHQMNSSGVNTFGIISQSIEQARSNGNLEPENYEQLMSSEFLGSEFQQEYTEAYTQQIPKMQEFLMQLETKLKEYLQVG